MTETTTFELQLGIPFHGILQFLCSNYNGGHTHDDAYLYAQKSQCHGILMIFCLLCSVYFRPQILPLTGSGDKTTALSVASCMCIDKTFECILFIHMCRIILHSDGRTHRVQD